MCLRHFCLSKSEAQYLASSRCSAIVCGREVEIFKEHFATPCASSQYLLSKAPRCLCFLFPETFVKLPLCRWLPHSFVLSPPARLPPSRPSGSLGIFLWEESARKKIPSWHVKQDDRDCSSVTLSWQGFPLCTHLEQEPQASLSGVGGGWGSAICSSPRGK